jgi:hypothetical protein
MKQPMLICTRVEGKNGYVRELTAVLDINSPYCMILGHDALVLGYSVAANKPADHLRMYPDEVPSLASLRGIERGIKIPLMKVSIGPLVATDVDALVFEFSLPRTVTFDLILGRSFLKNFKVTVDMKDGKKGYLSLLPTGRRRTNQRIPVQPASP